jgi:hypothetical protein
VLIVIGGLVTIIWDIWLQQKIGKLRSKWENRRRRIRDEGGDAEEVRTSQSIPPAQEMHLRRPEAVKRRAQAGSSTDRIVPAQENAEPSQSSRQSIHSVPATDGRAHIISVKLGITLIAAFLGMLLRYCAKYLAKQSSLLHRRNGHPQHPFGTYTLL